MKVEIGDFVRATNTNTWRAVLETDKDRMVRLEDNTWLWSDAGDIAEVVTGKEFWQLLKDM